VRRGAKLICFNTTTEKINCYDEKAWRFLVRGMKVEYHVMAKNPYEKRFSIESYGDRYFLFKGKMAKEQAKALESIAKKHGKVQFEEGSFHFKPTGWREVADHGIEISQFDWVNADNLSKLSLHPDTMIQEYT